jgi:capsular polysaccharide transport system permease protein
MTTPPKAARFRIRTDTVPIPGNPSRRPAAPDDGFGDEPFPTADQDVLGPAPQTPDAELEAVRAEGLTGRQLRTARRVAMKHGISAASDHDAVRLLRRRGIDPFRPAAVLQLIERKPAEEAGTPRLPQTVPPPGLPAKPADDAARDAARAREIMDIQRDIVRRRRRNFLMLLARLAVFVFLPTILAGWYYTRIATPLYATKTEFIIQQADAQVGGLGSMFRGTQFATSQDSIAVQGYLQSRDAMLRLDRDLGFKAHYTQAFIDPIQRLDPGASNEAAYRLYQRNVKIGYDPTEGLIKMEVIAADPAVSQSFAEALIGYAEEQVDQLSARLREDQMKGARDSFADAEAKVEAAQQKVLALQERLGVLDPMSESNAVMSQVATFEVELQKKRLELQQLLDNASPNQARVDGAKGDIARLEELIRSLRSQLTEGTASTASLAQVSGQLRIAEAELENRQLMLSQALQQLETARIEANRQVRYLETAVSPVAPDEPTYPRAFENTLLALLIFGGIYLMLSLTASILREQATS